jgi:NADPH-dependent F420 reductase
VSAVRIGILGSTGPAGIALATRLASSGMDVVVGSRSKERAVQTRDEIVRRWPDHGLTLDAAENTVAADAELVVIATPWDAAPGMAGSVAEHLAGKVVVSMANAVARVADELEPLVLPRGSVAAAVQAAAPQALVSAAFQHLPARDLGDLSTDLDGDVLVCSDHRTALEATSDVVRRIPGLRALDAGRLSSAGPIESFTAVLLSLNSRYRTRVALRLTGIRE